MDSTGFTPVPSSDRNPHNPSCHNNASPCENNPQNLPPCNLPPPAYDEVLMIPGENDKIVTNHKVAL